MKCVFMLASPYGLKCFDAVKELPCVEITGVITTCETYELKYGDKKNVKTMTNAVFHDIAARCKETDIPLYIMKKMNTDETIQKIESWNPELIIVSGWYHLIGKRILQIPQKGVIGLHPSSLPKYRGGAPLVWQIINGEKRAGITLFYFDEGVDSGDIIGQSEVEIEYTDTIGTLYSKIGDEGIRLLKMYLPEIEAGKAPRTKQENLSEKDIWPQRAPDDGIINWNNTSRQIYDYIRAQTKPYPGAYTYYKGRQYSIWAADIIQCSAHGRPPGTIIEMIDRNGKDTYVVATNDSSDAVMILEYSERMNLKSEGDGQSAFTVGDRFLSMPDNA